MSAFLYNAGRNSLVLTTASVICSNVGIGTFVVYFLFTRASPVVGLSIVAACTLGLLLCALLSRRIHEISHRTGAYSLVDLIVATHGVRQPLLIWIPVASVFLLRIMIQLIALSVILAEAFGLAPLSALAMATVLAGAYVAIGGYRAATETDLFHAAVIVVLVAVVALNLSPVGLVDRDYFDLGPYTPVLLVGVFLLLPFSMVLGIDNWQRIATAQSAVVAQRAYLIGTLICGLIYTLVAVVALLPDSQDDVLATFRALMPARAPWLADALFISAIVSSIDTFSVPLTSTFARQGLGLRQLRLLIAVLLGTVAVLAALIGDILSGAVAAFSSLAVFLPAVWGAIFLKNPRPEAATASMIFGVAATLALIAVDQNSAGAMGFVISAAIYWLLQGEKPALQR